MGDVSTTTPWALAIETSNPSSHAPGKDAPGQNAPGQDDPPAASVAACRLDGGGGLVDLEEVSLAPGGRHDDGLMPAVELLRSKLGVSRTDLTRVCVSIGPGGYTALRVAVSTAKLIAEATGAALVGVPSAAVVAANADCEPPFAVCLASKRGATHATVFEQCVLPSDGRVIGLIDENDLETLGVRVLIADGFLPEPIRSRANDLGMSVRPPRFSAAACLRIGLGLDAVGPAALSPVYAREPEAVRLWRTRKPG